MAHDVFISYASHDKQTADATCVILETRKISCWIAPRDILPGFNYAEAIINAIEECKIVVLILSSSSNTSPQVIREIERAVSKGVSILPLRIEDITLSKSMEFYVSSQHWLDATNPPLEKHLKKLAETIALILKPEEPQNDLSIHPPVEPVVELSPSLPVGLQLTVKKERKSNKITKFNAKIGIVVVACVAALAVGIWLAADAIPSWSKQHSTKVNWANGKISCKTISGHDEAVESVAFSPDGQKIVSGSYDKTIKIWSIDGTLLRTLNGHTDNVWSVAFSPDGQKIISADHTLKIWSIDGTLLRTLNGYTNDVLGIAFSPDGQRIATGAIADKVKIWNIDGTLLRMLDDPIPTNGAFSVAFSPDGQKIISGSADKTIKIWSIEGTLLRTLRGHTDYVLSVAFSPDGQKIISGSSDNKIKIWSIDGTLLRTLCGHTSIVSSVSFSPDGQMIASGSGDTTVKIWSIDGTLLQILSGHMGRVYTVAFSPDGSKVVSGSGDGTIKIWNVTD